jgi:hypothetical protein
VHQVRGYRECSLAAGPRPRRCVHIRPQLGSTPHSTNKAGLADHANSLYTPHTLLLRAPNDGLCRQVRGGSPRRGASPFEQKCQRGSA